MRIASFLALCLCPVLCCAQQQLANSGITTAASPSAMTNADVVKLAGLGLGDDVIVQKISTSRAVAFDTSIDGLQKLKDAKVSDSVIKAMLVQQAAIAASSPEASISTFHSTDGKSRVYITDHPINEVTSIIRGASVSSAHVNAYSAHAASASSVGGVSHSQAGDDPRTVELQADMQKVCPAYVLVSNNPARADYILVFRREGGKRSSFFAFGGLTGLALSAASKVDGASLFQPNGDMIFATRMNTVAKAVKESCLHIPPPQG